MELKFDFGSILSSAGRAASRDNVALVVVGAKTGRTGDLKEQCRTKWHGNLLYRDTTLTLTIPLAGRAASSANAPLAEVGANPSRTYDLK